MGRRRSKVIEQKKRYMAARASRQRERVRPRNVECPWCHSIGMFSKIQGSGRLILIGCAQCKLGERLPRQRYYRFIDYYHMLVDNKNDGKVPVFKYKELTEKDLCYIEDHITLGKVVCQEVIEEEEEDDEVSEL